MLLAHNGLYLEKVGCRVKKTEIWELGVVVTCIWGTVDLCCLTLLSTAVPGY